MGQKMKYNTVLTRIQNLTGLTPSQAELCKITGIKQNTMSNRANRDSDFTIDEIDLLNSYYGINIITNETQAEETVSVDYYPEVFGSCGGGTLVVSEQKELIQVPKKFFRAFSPVKKYSVIKAKGESMRPTLQPDDKLIIEHCGGEQIIDNDIYIFCYKDEIFVKRLVKNVDEIIILSDNNESIYRPRFIEKEEINNIIIIGRIVGLMREF